MEESSSSNAATLASQLPSIDGQLVTADHPPRIGLEGMDHARCAALHNYLVDYCRAADGRLEAAATRSSDATWLNVHGEAAEAIVSRLHPSLVAFFAAVRIPEAPFFFFVDDMPEPGGDDDVLFENEMMEADGEAEDSLVRLYFAHIDACGDECGPGGLLYHQGRHLACFFGHPDDAEYAFPMAEHPQSWHPLEAILSHWIDLIRVGKVAASPASAPARHGVKIGNWEWLPYSAAQVATCVAAWGRLCDAIEARRRQSPGAVADPDPDHAPGEPLLTGVALDEAAVPDPSFARAFLGHARRPRHIRHIAPGIGLPPADAAVFADAQPFTRLLRRVDDFVPPVYMFFSDGGAAAVDMAGDRTTLGSHWRDGVACPARIPPGVYSECVVRSELEPAEEAFRLPLPFALPGARLSCGTPTRNSALDQLFQHGFKPWGGNPHRPQRLERLLDHWAGLVERGVWSVGPHGVMGSIDVLKDATVDWASYTIPPSW